MPESLRAASAYLYFGPLTLLVYIALPDGYLLDIATSFMLKNQLQATPTQIAAFRVLTALPIYGAVLFGLIRDRYSPLGLRDRGYFLVFGPLSAAVLVGMAVLPLSYAVLFWGMLLLIFAFRFISAAYQGLLALVGQEHGMSGRLSAVYNTGSFICYVVGALASGYATEQLTPRGIFLAGAGLTLLIALVGCWRPRAIFERLYSRPQARHADLLTDLRLLVRHRAAYPAVLTLFLANIAPGTSTALQFYLSDELHAPDAVFANFTALNMAAYIPAFLVYGYLCRHFTLNRLLWWGTLVAIPAAVPLLFAHDIPSVLLSAIPTGLTCGLAQAAYMDLAMRSCPAGQQGTLMMLVIALWSFALRGSDLLGAWLYGAFPGQGFAYCVLCACLSTALILPLLWLIPAEVVVTADGAVTE